MPSMSPYQAHFGHPRRQVVDALLNSRIIPLEPTVGSDMDAALKAYHDAIESTITLAYSRSKAEQEARASRINSYLKEHRTFKIDDYVLLQNVSTPGKGHSHFSPVPYKVLEVEEHDTYRLRSLLSQNVTLRAHAQHMRLLDLSRFSAAESLQYALADDEHVVKAISDHKVQSDGTFLFLVEWIIPGSTVSTWEPQETLSSLRCYKQYVKDNHLRVPKHKPRNSPGTAFSFFSLI